MSASQRIKGRRAEAEVAALLRAAGFTVRGLESGGDHLAVGHGVTLHIEVKRQERGFRAAWAAQALRDAPPGSIPCVVYRRSREAWRIAVPHPLLTGTGMLAHVEREAAKGWQEDVIIPTYSVHDGPQRWVHEQLAEWLARLAA